MLAQQSCRMDAEGAHGRDAAGSAAEAEAEACRAKGNEHFKAQKHEEAAGCYRQALELLRDAAQAAGSNSGSKVRLNLAACLQKLGSEPGEVLQLCSEVLAADSSNVKALFRRGAAQRDLARTLTDVSARKDMLMAAKRDLREAARLEPSERQVRAALDEISEELKVAGGGAVGNEGLRLGFGRGLYDDREAAPPPSPPVVCSVCGREGHPQCGRALWLQQRAAWLGVPVEEVARNPPSFEDDGTLRKAIRAARAAGVGGAAAASEGPPAADAATGLQQGGVMSAGAGAGGLVLELHVCDEEELPSLSTSEQEELEDCLDAVERPFPKLKRALALPQAVKCAELLWSEDG